MYHVTFLIKSNLIFSFIPSTQNKKVMPQIKHLHALCVLRLFISKIFTFLYIDFVYFYALL